MDQMGYEAEQVPVVPNTPQKIRIRLQKVDKESGKESLRRMRH